MPDTNVTISSILAEKGSIIHSIDPASSVHEAVAKMNREKIGSILVMEGQKVVGIFTERDVLTRVVENARDPKATPIRDVMTSDFHWISPNTSIDEAMEKITQKRARHLPVFDEDENLLGLVSIGDILRLVIKLHEMESEHLKQYIFGQ